MAPLELTADECIRLKSKLDSAEQEGNIQLLHDLLREIKAADARNKLKVSAALLQQMMPSSVRALATQRPLDVKRNLPRSLAQHRARLC